MTLFETLKTAVGALALSAGMASAATVQVNHGDDFLIGAGETFQGTFDIEASELSDNEFTVDFTVEQGGAGEARVSLVPLVAGEFTNLVLAFVDSGGDVLDSVGIGAGITTLSTVFTSPDTLTQTLRISFDSAEDGASFDGQVVISAIPLPAGGLLLLTALGAAIVLRRRSTVA